MLDFTGKRILVTGASAGIGRATAQVLSRLGAVVVLTARNETRLQDTLAGLDGTGHALYPFDLAAVDEIPALVKQISREAGPLAGIFHAAGILAIQPVQIVKERSIQQALSVSLHAALLLARGFAQKGVTEHGGSLVFMSSVAGQRGRPGMSLYSAGKAALDGAVRSLACELAPRAIRVNAIAAGAVQTDMHAAIVQGLSEQGISEYERHHLLGFGAPEDIAAAAAFLLSDAARWITGTTMVVDGGYSCQ